MNVQSRIPGALALTDIDGEPRIVPRWGRYAVWQLRDYARTVGLPGLVLAAAAVALLADSTPDRFTSHNTRAFAVSEFLVGVGFLGSVFSVTGLVSSDRTRGWYRFMFAKPVSVLRYYSQAFALRGVGLLGIVTIAWALCAIFVEPVSLLRALDATLLQFTLLGGVTLLLSTMIRLEWLAVLVISVISPILGEFARGLNAPRWARLLHWVLPPVGDMATLALGSLGGFGGWLAHSLVPTVLWVVGYGAAAFVAALAILERREWGR